MILEARIKNKNIDKTKILLVDDHPVVRQGLIKTIEQDLSFEIVGQGGDGAEVISLIKFCKPDLVVLDISLPNLSGLEIVRESGREKLSVEFIMLTMYKDEEYFDAAIKLGVKGYLIKDTALCEILNCLKAVRSGHYFICPQLSHYLINRYERLKSLTHRMPALELLTPAEKKILRLIAENKTSREIAEEICVSIRTVQNHRNHICRKLDLKGYNKLLQFAIENRSAL